MENREPDMEEWEFIPNQTSYLDLTLHSPKKELHFNPQIDYFVCPSSSIQEKDVAEPEFKENIGIVPEFKEKIDVVPEFKVKEVDEPEFKDIGVVPDVDMESSKSIMEMNTRYHEKEVKNEEFQHIPEVDMESSKSIMEINTRYHENEVKDEEFEHIDKEDDFKEERIEETKRKACCRFGGVGALCSIGVVAATICIFVLGGRQQQQQKQQFQNQRIQFQIYGDDKRMKQVVQQAGRLNQAWSVAVRGVPATRAHISFGGYYDGV